MFARKRFTLLIATIICISSITLTCVAQDGRIVRETIYSPSLEGNLLGDSPNRPVTIYLPPSYDDGNNMAYPVVYLLHGYTGNNESWISGYGNIITFMKSWLSEKRVKEMIIVMPNSLNKLYGSQYINSTATGKWADYIVKYLVKYIDSRYRTLPQRESRAVLGHSMGAHGAIRLGLSYPKIFSCIGGMAGDYDMEDYINTYMVIWASASTIENWSQFSNSNWQAREAIAWSAAFVPNPSNPPFYCDFTFVYTKTEPKEIVKNQEVYDKILKHDILKNLDSYLDALLSMRAIYIDCGVNDEYGLIRHARKFHDKLQNYVIEHTYKEFAGGHMTGVINHTGDALEVFSKAMAFEMLVGVEPLDKFAVTWGEIRK
jgi:S-formylglutathione hydrolase